MNPWLELHEIENYSGSSMLSQNSKQNTIPQVPIDSQVYATLQWLSWCLPAKGNNVNQSIKFLYRQYPWCSQVRGVTAKSVSNSKIKKQLCNINGPLGVLSIGESPSQRDVFWDASWRFQLEWLSEQVVGGCSKTEGAQEWKAPRAFVGLDPSNQQSDSFLWSQWPGCKH